VKSACDIVIFSHDAGTFGEFGKKSLFRQVMHERESARSLSACQAILLFLWMNFVCNHRSLVLGSQPVRLFRITGGPGVGIQVESRSPRLPHCSKKECHETGSLVCISLGDSLWSIIAYRESTAPVIDSLRLRDQDLTPRNPCARPAHCRTDRTRTPLSCGIFGVLSIEECTCQTRMLLAGRRSPSAERLKRNRALRIFSVRKKGEAGGLPAPCAASGVLAQ
jgi:hypothetical protein